MKFKEFTNWCNERCMDGYWGIKEALICCETCKEIKGKPLWKREKVWRKQYENTIVSQIVKPINKKIKGLLEEE